jgi:hypothetical protein
MTAPLWGRGEFFVVRVRPKQDGVGRGPGLRGAWCLPGKARWCTLAHQRASASTGFGFYRVLSVISIYKIDSNKPRYHNNSRADKEPQFLERLHRTSLPVHFIAHHYILPLVL